MWAVAITESDGWALARAAGIAALAYGLTAFWLSPSYLRVTLENMRLVSQPGHAWSMWLEAAVMAAFAAVSWRMAKGNPARAWQVSAHDIAASGYNLDSKNPNTVDESHEDPDVLLARYEAAVQRVRAAQEALRSSFAESLGTS